METNKIALSNEQVERLRLAVGKVKLVREHGQDRNGNKHALDYITRVGKATAREYWDFTTRERPCTLTAAQRRLARLVKEGVIERFGNFYLSKNFIEQTIKPVEKPLAPSAHILGDPIVDRDPPPRFWAGASNFGKYLSECSVAFLTAYKKWKNEQSVKYSNKWSNLNKRQAQAAAYWIQVKTANQ